MTYKLHYILDHDHDSHPYKACIVSPLFIGHEISFRDENQLRCYALGFLHATPHCDQSMIELERVTFLPNIWDRQQIAFRIAQ